MKKITFLLIALLVATISYSQTVLLDENFDGATAPDWGNYVDGTGVQNWTFGSGVVPGAVADFTTNAAIFDDDAAGDTGNHDIAWIWYAGPSTAGIDASSYGQVTLSYDYALNVISGNGETLSVGLWNGTTFVPMKVYNTDTDPTSDSIDITAFLNAHPGVFDPASLFIGFGFDDNTSWGYGAGIDNVMVTGSVQPSNDFMFIHTSTAANITSNRTIIDHPDLNGNPDAKIVVSHNWNPGGVGGTGYNNVTGVWYNGSRWTIYNEVNSIDMPAGISFNVYVRGNDSNVITHISTVENSGGVDWYSIIDNPIINGDPNAMLVMDGVFNPNGVFNNLNYGFYYNGTNWVIYSEDDVPIPTGAAFNVIVSPSNNNVESFKHQNTVANTYSISTIIDNPLLNGKPNAAFVFSHNWGGSGDVENVNLEGTLGAWYDGTNWEIYRENGLNMPDNAAFNIVVMNTEVTATPTNTLTNISIYPNPAEDTLTVESQEALTKVAIFNLLGQEVKSLNTTATNVNIDVANLDAGVYIIKLTANNKESSQKFIKK